MRDGYVDRVPDVLRFSSIVGALRANGDHRGAAELERLRLLHGMGCTTHGPLEDPIVGVVGEGARAQVAFGCPWCSSPEILAAWEAEGQRS